MNKFIEWVGTSLSPLSAYSTITYVSKMIQMQVMKRVMNKYPIPRGLLPISMPIIEYRNRVVIIVEITPPKKRNERLLEKRATLEKEANDPKVYTSA